MKQLRKKQSGFTLLEILVALAVFLIMAILATAGLYNVFRNKEIITEHDNQLQALQLSLAIINHDMQQIIDRPVVDSDGKYLLGLTGSATFIDFTKSGFVNPLSQDKRSNLQRIRYEFKGQSISRSFWPVLDRVPSSTPSTKTLFTGVNKFQIRYIDKKQQYHSSWPPQKQAYYSQRSKQPFPVAIEVSFTTSNWGDIYLMYLVHAGSLYDKQQGSRKNE